MNDLRIRIFNVALKLFRKRCSSDEVKDNPQAPQEVRDCDSMLDEAIEMALAESDWSFFITEIELEEDEGKARGWEHSYALPLNIQRVVVNFDYPFEIIGKKFYCNEDNPNLWGIPKYEHKIFNNKGNEYFFRGIVHPKTFEFLVGYALAFLIAPLLAPQDQTIMQNALQRYSLYAKSLKDQDVFNNQKETSWCGDSPYKNLFEN